MGKIKGTEKRISLYGGTVNKLIFSNEDMSVAYERKILKEAFGLKQETLLDFIPVFGELENNKSYTDFCDRLTERCSEFMKGLNDRGYVTIRVEYYENGRIYGYIDNKLVGNVKMNPTYICDKLKQIRDMHLLG